MRNLATLGRQSVGKAPDERILLQSHGQYGVALDHNKNTYRTPWHAPCEKYKQSYLNSRRSESQNKPSQRQRGVRNDSKPFWPFEASTDTQLGQGRVNRRLMCLSSILPLHYINSHKRLQTNIVKQQDLGACLRTNAAQITRFSYKSALLAGRQQRLQTYFDPNLNDRRRRRRILSPGRPGREGCMDTAQRPHCKLLQIHSLVESNPAKPEKRQTMSLLCRALPWRRVKRTSSFSRVIRFFADGKRQHPTTRETTKSKF